MTVKVDTREKKHAHILAYFKRNGIDYIQEKMDTGDYQIVGDNSILIDRKQNIHELASNIWEDLEAVKKNKPDRQRFKNELKRLDKLGSKMYILIEENLSCLEDVQKWKSKCDRYGKPYTKMYGATIYRYLVAYKWKHNIEYVFCHKNSTGRIIAELLGVK